MGIRATSIEELLAALSSRTPSRQSVEALLKKHAPELAAVFAAGWTDEEIVEAFETDEANRADCKELRRLLLQARKRNRVGRKRVKQTKQWRSDQKPERGGDASNKEQVTKAPPDGVKRSKPRASGV